jgi:hypothetical protein
MFFAKIGEDNLWRNQQLEKLMFTLVARLQCGAKMVGCGCCVDLI